MAAEPTTEYRPLRFKNPPIVEAVIGVNIAPLEEGALEALKNAAANLGSSDYKQPTPITVANFQMMFAPGASKASARDSAHGWQVDSADGLYRAKFQRDGFLFSQLGRYVSWELFRGEAHKLWTHYVEAIGGGRTVTGFGVRYVNKVFIPEGVDLEDYLTCYPTLPPTLPPSLLESFMRLVMPIENPDGKLTHQHILVGPEKPGFATVILDNDFRFPVAGVSYDEVWVLIDSVRRIKDEYFRKLVTEKMRKTFDD